MKQKIFTILLLLCILLAGCSRPEDPVVPGTETSDSLLEEYLSDLNNLATPVRQYGENTGYIQMEEELVVRIQYPESDLTALNNTLETWVRDTVAYYQSEADGNNIDGASAELTADYDSYLVDDRWISVRVTGFFDKPYLAHPIDIIATFHANRDTGELITLDELLLPGGRSRLQNMVIKDAGIKEADIDGAMLDLWTLTQDGLEITLARGEYLPMSDGTKTLQYSYEDLSEILVLSERPAIPETSGEESSESPAEETISSEPESNTNDSAASPSPDPDKPMIALTFDDGPSKHTDRLLDIFAAHGGKGTFFVVGNIIDKRPETLKRMAAEGHEIAGHSWDHRQLTKLTTDDLTGQIMNTRAKIFDVTGVDSTMLRPPYGSYNDTVKQVCADLGIIMVNWSVDTLDWKYLDADKVYHAIMDTVSDGDIILCHDLHGTTVDAMERVIPDLIAQGYQLVTVSDLLSFSDKEVTSGNVYNKQ